MKTIWWAVAFGVVIGLLAAGMILLAAAPPRGTVISLLPPPTPAPILIHVAGAVRQPGLYELPPKARVRDALQAAGGALPSADESALNLAALVEDGQKLLIPERSLAATTPAPNHSPTPGTSPGAPAAPANSSGPIDLNTASVEELDSLPGIGPAMAARILAYRQEHGGFKTIEEIQEVSGIGPATFEKLKDLITINS